MWRKKEDIFKISPKKFGDTEIKSYLCIRIIHKRINKRHRYRYRIPVLHWHWNSLFFMLLANRLLITLKQQENYGLHVTRRLRQTRSWAEARDKGDLSENSEYDAAKEAQAHLEDKINRLKLTIAEAKIIDTKQLSTDSVQIMSKVEMTNMANKAKMTYTIVSESEANLKEGKISIKTPIAQGLLNKKVGEVAEIKIPRGTINLRIDKISFE